MAMIDGVPAFSLNKLMEVDPAKVRQIDVVRKSYYLNGVGFSGIASFRTYEGNMAGFEPDARALVFDYEGLSLQKEYYRPAYSSSAEIESRIPDRRTLLAWFPEIDFAGSEQSLISFFTSDIQGTFVIDLQGIDAGGHAVSSTTFFKVK